MRFKTYSYRYGEEIMNAKLSIKKEIEDIVGEIKTQMKKGASNEINKEFLIEFNKKDWTSQAKVTDDLGLSIDFKKERIGVEVQLGNVARLYADLFKLQIMSFSALDMIDVGVIILPMAEYARKLGTPIANFEKLIRELPYFKSLLQVPLWIIGLEE